MKKILHIANWYPNKWDDLEGIFIKEQYNVFSKVTDSHLIHVQVRDAETFMEYKYIKYSDREEGYYFLTSIKFNKLIEFLTTFLLLWALVKSNYKKYDLLHFHIAYPLLIHYYLWKRIMKMPIIISEHWSAYHFNFYMPKSTKKLGGIKRIFRQKIALITVSKALRTDIQNFGEIVDFPSIVIPNIINKSYKSKDDLLGNIPSFFIVNIWREIKNPFSMLEAFAHLSDGGIQYRLQIGGYGELLEKMKQFVKNRQLESNITFLGKMDNKQIEKELNNCDAYLFSSKYETFSVACADALNCGCPLIGPAIPSVLEYTNSKELICVDHDTSTEWQEKLYYFIHNRAKYNKQQIASRASDYFSNKKIQKSYIGFINEYC